MPSASIAMATPTSSAQQQGVLKRSVLVTNPNEFQKTRVVSEELVVGNLAPGEVRLQIDKIGLSANNKFYLSYGNDPTFNFFKVYPAPKQVQVGGGKDDDDDDDDDNVVCMPAWGVATVVASKVDGILVGEHFFGFLPIADYVQFQVVPSTSPAAGFVVQRGPEIFKAYNQFVKVADAKTTAIAASNNPQESGLAIVSWPGVVTGYGIVEQLRQQNLYGEATKVVVLTSASSKVSLATALFLKKEFPALAIVGYTSEQNREFCRSTSLYDVILGYDQAIPDEVTITSRPSGQAPTTTICSTNGACLLVDVAGNYKVCKRNEKKTRKVLCVGNAHDYDNEDAVNNTFKGGLGFWSSLKLIMTLMGVPKFLRNWVTPKYEVFLIMDVSKHPGFMERVNTTAMQAFVQRALQDKWIQVRCYDRWESIQAAFAHICQGTTPPNEATLLKISMVATSAATGGSTVGKKHT